MIKTLTSIFFGIKRQSLSVVNIKLISFKYPIISNRVSSQLRRPIMQQDVQIYSGNGSGIHKQQYGKSQKQHGGYRQQSVYQQHHGGNQLGGNRGNQKEEFEFFFGPNFTFSQMHPARFTVDGIEFCCMEQYMQFQKAMTFGDNKTAKLIMSTPDPKEHKKLGRKVSPFDPKQWGWKSKAVVRKGNIQKYQQNPSMKRELFDTFPKTLVEASPRDRLWGIGLGKDNPKARDRSQWRGKNLLGQILTEVRNHLMTQEGFISSKSSSVEVGHEPKKEYSSFQHEAKLDDKNSSSAKFKDFSNPKAEFHKNKYDKHDHNKKDKDVSKKSEEHKHSKRSYEHKHSKTYDEHKHSSPDRFGTKKSGGKDEKIPIRSTVRDKITSQKERSDAGKTPSSKKRKYNESKDSSRLDGRHQSDEKSPSSKKRKCEDGEDSSRSDERHQSDEKSPSSKKRKCEDREDSSRSDERHQSDQKSPSSKKRKCEDGKDSSRSDERHQSGEKSPSSKKRKCEDSKDSSRSDGRHQSDEKSPSSKKRNCEDGEYSSRSDEKHQSGEKSPSSKKRKSEDGEYSSPSDEKQGKRSSENNVTNNKDEKAASILEPYEVKKGEQDKEKDRDVETEETCNQKADKSEARATTGFIITDAMKSKDDTHADSGENKQKKITVRLPETEVCDKDERSNKDARATSK